MTFLRLNCYVTSEYLRDLFTNAKPKTDAFLIKVSIVLHSTKQLE
jgi:hypothetical protein